MAIKDVTLTDKLDLLEDDIDEDFADCRHIKKSGTFKYVSLEEGPPKSPGRSPGRSPPAKGRG